MLSSVPIVAQTTASNERSNPFFFYATTENHDFQKRQTKIFNFEKRQDFAPVCTENHGS